MLTATRATRVRVFFSRHLSLPKELMGMFQFRMAMAWQRTDSPEQVIRAWPTVSARAHARGMSRGKQLRERIARYIEACPPAISGQNGHDQTFRVACILVQGFDLSPEDAYSFLARYNQRCEPPWSERELRHKLCDADRTQSYKPRGYLL